MCSRVLDLNKMTKLLMIFEGKVELYRLKHSYPNIIINTVRSLYWYLAFNNKYLLSTYCVLFTCFALVIPS